MVGQHQEYEDSDAIASEDEYECYRAAFNSSGHLFCLDSSNGKEVLVSLEDEKPSEKLIVPNIGKDHKNVMDVKPETWDIDYADIQGHLEISRYYCPVQMTCYNCNENGHVKYDCPKPRKEHPCLSCGMTGHNLRDCSHELCFNCGNPGHSKKDCSKPMVPRWKNCPRCHTPGHTESHCPDRWRQYHSTTSYGPPVEPEPAPVPDNRPIYCYNCGRDGHWGFECQEERPDDAYYIGTQFVVRYDASASSLAPRMKRKVKGKQADNNDQPGFSDSVVSDGSTKNAAKKKRNKSYFPRSKSLASEFPAKEKTETWKRRSKSVDETSHFKETNLSKFKSRSHKSFEKLRNSDGGKQTDSPPNQKPRKYNKIKEELERMGINKSKKKMENKKGNPRSRTENNVGSDGKSSGNHVSFKVEKNGKRGSGEYGYNWNKPSPNLNHGVNGERTKSKNSQKGPEGKSNTQQAKKNKKKNKKNNGFQKSTSVFS
ncbi:zinc finger CCHC domain-containing protein 7-like [Bolinopsis microptera]|uniref:zinc finger CCHC domain-containing protein 7-like n=1 Tax=Bolinopsis microptera TaxID=2820187 RepID=UPI00307960B8